METGLTVLILDVDGPDSRLAQVLRETGHRVVTAMGLETALVVLGGLTPDLILVRSSDPAADEQALARLQQAAPDVPARLADGATPFAHPTDGVPMN
jgi:hypothetical protein